MQIQIITPMKHKLVTIKELEPFQVVGHDVKMNLGSGPIVTVNKNMLDRLVKGGVWTIEPTEAGFRQAHEKLMEAAGASGAAYIPVTKAGSGPTDKSRKIRVDEVVHLLSCVDWNRNPIFSEKGTHNHTLTVPASLLIEREGQLYAPRWMLNRTICERVFQKRKDRSDWSVTIKNGVFLDSEKIWNDFWALLLVEASRIVEEEAQNVQKARDLYAAQAPERARIREMLEKHTGPLTCKYIEVEGPVDILSISPTRLSVLNVTLYKVPGMVYFFMHDGTFVQRKSASITRCVPSKNNP